MDGSDPWLHFVYDDQWRIVATFRGSDSSPKEQFVYHYAGRAELGASSSYIDAVVLRDRDMTNGWAGAADGTLEERTFYCQNWRADVVAMVTSGGAQVQQVRYGEYGEAFGLPKGDTDGDGDVNSGNTVDSDQIQTWINGSAYDVRGDLDLDGDVQSDDKTAAIAMAGTVLGWGSLSLAVGASAGGNRKGYAGYENDGVLEASQIYHVRNRVYHVVLANWTKRDFAEHEDTANLYQYSRTNPVSIVDTFGLMSVYLSTIPAPPWDLKCRRLHSNCVNTRWNPLLPDYGPYKPCLDCLWYCLKTSVWPSWKCPPSWRKKPIPEPTPEHTPQPSDSFRPTPIGDCVVPSPDGISMCPHEPIDLPTFIPPQHQQPHHDVPVLPVFVPSPPPAEAPPSNPKPQLPPRAVPQPNPPLLPSKPHVPWWKKPIRVPIPSVPFPLFPEFMNPWYNPRPADPNMA